ncbi:NAD(P)/FAD-dependent oxidoreductase [Mucilaginibacter lacusdianchii]|uniref:NAD(P)/FAD-dependent oxidoreductase n=1 Tax=Mucilaginibacter lacusdianchii TaxID=2684211 RepID=UPI00131EC83C|nr:NAD(P)/FAD-dependent oxidoreductase [Mucilaginibacter sp. JXJ CY 39]
MKTDFDVIIVGGSNAGLSAGMSLGRSLRDVLIIDSGKPCNRQTPASHNFITHDGWRPAEILEAARHEVLAYPTVSFLESRVNKASGSNNDFNVTLDDQRQFKAKKLLFATGIKDLMPAIDGFAECWGISAIHCPYCHGYEYRGQTTGVLMNGDNAADYIKLISNWTKDLTLFTNGQATITTELKEKIWSRNINIVEKEIEGLIHEHGHITHITFKDGSNQPLTALYHRPAFEQHCSIPEHLGCALTEQGFIQVNELKKTTVAGVYAAGDNSTPMRSVASAVAAGNFTGAMINHEMISEAEWAA